MNSIQDASCIGKHKTRIYWKKHNMKKKISSNKIKTKQNISQAYWSKTPLSDKKIKNTSPKKMKKWKNGKKLNEIKFKNSKKWNKKKTWMNLKWETLKRIGI